MTGYVLKEFTPEENPIIKNALLSLDQNVSRTIRSIESKRSSDLIKNQTRETIDYAKEITEGGFGGILTSFISSGRLENRRLLSQIEQNVIFPVVKSLGFIPSQNLKSFPDLLNAVRNANNQPSSGMPYIERGRLEGLESKKPGLEGVQAILIYDTTSRQEEIQLTGSPEVFTRIFDKGQYTPYIQQSR